MESIINQFVKPELLILVPVLFIIGYFLKSNPKINNPLIPLILSIISIVLSTIWIFSVSTMISYMNVLEAIFSSITQGILLAGAAVLSNEIIKIKKDLSEDKKS